MKKILLGTLIFIIFLNFFIPSKVMADPVPIGPSQESTLDKGTYTLLAPIGDFKEIQTDGTGTCPGNPEMKSGLGCYLNILFKIGIGVCGAIAVIMIVIGGIQLMGNESVFGKVEAKQKIFQALFGLLIALGAFALLNTIDPNLTGRNGVKVDQVSALIDDDVELEQDDPVYTVGGGAPAGAGAKICEGGYVDVATYGSPTKINICRYIAGIPVADNLKKMLDAAKADGVILSGSGSRSYATQVALRIKNHCADVYTASSKTCSPETARPGRSNHEGGGAVDFTCNGKKMNAAGGRNSVCFKWLAANASRYHFKNLPSESWHWSWNGK